MSKNWERLETSVKKPENAGKDEYRDRTVTVLSDNKLWFFGLKGVDPTDSDKWHETMLLGTFLSIYDLTAKKWTVQDLPVIDPDKTKREHLFTVADKIFLFIYGVGIFPKLFQWQNGEFKKEVKIDFGACCDSKEKKASDFKFFAAPDGLYSLFESGGFGLVAKLTVEMDANGKEAKGAKSTVLGKIDLSKHFHIGGHLTGMAFSDKKIFVWGGQEGCGFHWCPSKFFYTEVDHKSNTMINIDELKSVEGPTPPYAYGGPYLTLQVGKKWVMLGGSRQVGLGQIEDLKEVWLFDTQTNTFKKTSLEMPAEVKGYRVSFAFNAEKGDLYVCDNEKGIFKTNLKAIL